MLTISQLAKQAGISRTTILYYEKAGLLLPTQRSENGYRWYGENAVARLEMILAYRSFGVPVAKLSAMLDGNNKAVQQGTLRDQFKALEDEIQKLRLQQKAIVQFMEMPELQQGSAMTKERWTAIMAAAGLNEADMRLWHKKFETMEPQGHQQFLESLDINAEEISEIRQWSQDE